MRDCTGKHDGPLVVDSDLALHGLVVGRTTVLGGVTLQHHGLITDDLVAEPGSIVVVHGKVDGAVINDGGDVTILGMVGAVTGTHPSRIEAGAVVTS